MVGLKLCILGILMALSFNTIRDVQYVFANDNILKYFF